MMLPLQCHPDTLGAVVERVFVNFAWTAPGKPWFEYSVYPSLSLVLPPERDPVRADGLWQTTCFEFFARSTDRAGYLEFNFSPSFEWAAYAFDGYRSGMAEFPTHDPEITISGGPNNHFFLAAEAMPVLPGLLVHFGFSAVIEETSGHKSYWALAHPPGPPDFHHPDCFALTLPPVG